jgi:hypothetical protein
MTPTHEEFRNDHIAVAFLITFRTYGTWLHGDTRGSVDRLHNRYGTPKLSPNPRRQRYEQSLLKQPPVRLSLKQREAAADGIREICKKKDWGLWASTYVPIMVTLSSQPIAVQKKSGRY